MINKGSGGTGGTILRNTYSQQRILDGDPFFAAIIN